MGICPWIPSLAHKTRKADPETYSVGTHKGQPLHHTWRRLEVSLLEKDSRGLWNRAEGGGDRYHTSSRKTESVYFLNSRTSGPIPWFPKCQQARFTISNQRLYSQTSFHPRRHLPVTLTVEKPLTHTASTQPSEAYSG